MRLSDVNDFHHIIVTDRNWYNSVMAPSPLFITPPEQHQETEQDIMAELESTAGKLNRLNDLFYDCREYTKRFVTAAVLPIAGFTLNAFLPMPEPVNIGLGITLAGTLVGALLSYTSHLYFGYRFEKVSNEYKRIEAKTLKFKV
jgi:hypothetical protein